MSTTVGMNLGGVTYYSESYPFIDRMKTASDWQPDNGAAAPIVLNQYGYPTAVPSGAGSVLFLAGIDPPALAMTDRYVLTWEGSAGFGVIGAQVVSQSAGRMVIEAGAGINALDIRGGGFDASNPLRNMHLVREDQEALFQQGQTFNPEFLEKIEPFSTLRMMDWGRTNNAALGITWNTRPRVDDFSWSSSNERVPLEVMVRLANETSNNLWYNIPFAADDDYVQHAVQYIRDNLRPELKIYLEYSNEVWNWAFPAATKAAEKAVQLWGHDTNGDGQINFYDPNEVPDSGHLVYYGYRAAQLAQVAQSAFGADPSNRLNTVLATQTAYTGLEQVILGGVRRVGDPSALFDAYAVTTYFGLSFVTPYAQDHATVLQWARGGAAGMEAAFHELEFGGALVDDSSLAALAKTLNYQKTIADANGWDLVAYEGGQHMDGTWSGNAAEDADIYALINRMLVDPRMGDIYSKMVTTFAKAGGTELVAFSDTGKFWGALDTIYQDHSARYDALVAAAQAGDQASNVVGGAGADILAGTPDADTLRGQSGNDYYVVNSAGDVVIEVANGGIDEIATSLTTYTLPNFVETLTYIGHIPFTGTGNDLANLIVGGTHHDSLFGAAGADTLIGGVGFDTLDGGTGADTMAGGVGDDRYIVDDTNDVIVELAGQGMDRALASVSYTLGANIEKLTLTGNAAIDGTGNAIANEIYGNDAANRLFGGFGNDVLSGALGDDWLDGGDGADVLDAGLGADTLVGGTGNDVMMGGAGGDRMMGGVGDDTYYVDDTGDIVIEAAGEGRDLVRATIDYTLPAEVERLWLSGTAVSGSGNALDNVITYAGTRGVLLSGLGGNDTIEGAGGDDTLDGGAGDDRLTGGAGGDVMIGGAGRDILDGGAGADRFVIRPGDSSATSSAADLIVGFSHADGDRIDLSAFDAIPGGADDPFRFVGGAEFSRSAGELRAIASAADTMTVFGDTDGDGVADFSLLVSTSVPLVTSDFVL